MSSSLSKRRNHRFSTLHLKRNVVGSALVVFSLLLFHWSQAAYSEEPDKSDGLIDRNRESLLHATDKVKPPRGYAVNWVAALTLIKRAQGMEFNWHSPAGISLGVMYFRTLSGDKKNLVFDLNARDAYWSNLTFRGLFFWHNTSYTAIGYSSFTSGHSSWMEFTRTSVDISMGNQILHDNGFICGLDWIGYSHELKSNLKASSAFFASEEMHGGDGTLNQFDADESKLRRILKKSPFTFFTFRFGWVF